MQTGLRFLRRKAERTVVAPGGGRTLGLGIRWDRHRSPARATAARLLCLLVEHAGELVRHERIIDALWPDATVDYEQGIHNVVRQVRRALGDDPRTPTYVESVPRQGYRFIATVESARPSALGARVGRAPLLWGAAALALLVVAVGIVSLASLRAPRSPVLAVLPLEDGGDATTRTHLGASVSWDLARDLARAAPGVRVLGERSVSTLVQRGADVREIGRELGATHALVGDLAGSEGRVLLRLQLLDADDGTAPRAGERGSRSRRRVLGRSEPAE